MHTVLQFDHTAFLGALENPQEGLERVPPINHRYLNGAGLQIARIWATHNAITDLVPRPETDIRFTSCEDLAYAFLANGQPAVQEALAKIDAPHQAICKMIDTQVNPSLGPHLKLRVRQGTHLSEDGKGYDHSPYISIYCVARANEDKPFERVSDGSHMPHYVSLSLPTESPDSTKPPGSMEIRCLHWASGKLHTGGSPSVVNLNDPVTFGTVLSARLGKLVASDAHPQPDATREMVRRSVGNHCAPG